MGNCGSCDQSRPAVTAKLVLVDGQLQQFSYPIKVSLLLQQSPDCFICSSEEMEFDQFAAEIGGDEVLQPGEVYFVLPLWWRRQRLQAEDMAALAVKASLALSTYCSSTSYDEIMCCCCVWRKVEPMMLSFSTEKERPLLAAGGGGGGGWKRSKFVAKLSGIEE